MQRAGEALTALQIRLSLIMIRFGETIAQSIAKK
jgi:hypothetical protein